MPTSLDWSQVRDNVMSLIVDNEIENALLSEDESVTVLTDSIISIMGNIEEITAALNADIEPF